MTKERIPILLWGDLVKHGKPVLRRALAGNDAHEAMYSWVYLTDYLSLRRLKDELATKDLFRLTASLFVEFDTMIWQAFDRSIIDPHFQVTKYAFEPMAHLMAISAANAATNPVFVELGSTFFAAIEKFDILDLVARNVIPRWPKIEPAWIGIENASFSNDVAHTLHPGRDLPIVGDWSSYKRTERFTCFYSRFVASYTFPDAATFGRFIVENCDAAVIEDPYSTTDEDVHVFNHGQKETFFSFSAVLHELKQAGFAVFLLNHYPDYPKDAAPCHVIRYVAIKDTIDRAAYGEYLKKLGWTGDALTRPAVPKETLAAFNAAMTRNDWASVKRQKAASPVWGPSDLSKVNSICDVAKSMIRGLLSRVGVLSIGWGRYRMEGSSVTDAIFRAVGKVK